MPWVPVCPVAVPVAVVSVVALAAPAAVAGPVAVGHFKVYPAHAAYSLLLKKREIHAAILAVVNKARMTAKVILFSVL